VETLKSEKFFQHQTFETTTALYCETTWIDGNVYMGVVNTNPNNYVQIWKWNMVGNAFEGMDIASPLRNVAPFGGATPHTVNFFSFVCISFGKNEFVAAKSVQF